MPDRIEPSFSTTPKGDPPPAVVIAPASPNQPAPTGETPSPPSRFRKALPYAISLGLAVGLFTAYRPQIMAVVGIAPSLPIAAGPFHAYISCGMQGRNINALACFQGTELKIIAGGQARVYRIQELSQLPQDSRGIRFNLGTSFQLLAQNSHQNLILEVIVFDTKTGQRVFQDQAGMFAVISIAD